MELKDLVIGVLGKTLNMPGKAIESLIFNEDGTLKSDSQSAIEAKFADKIKDVQETTRSQTAGKVVKEERAKFETEIKEAFGLKTDKIGVDLVQHLVDTKVKKSGEITDDDVKKSKLYLSLEEDLKKEKASADERVKKATEEVESKYKTEAQKATVVAKARESLLNEFKPVLSENPKVRANQLRMFEEAVAGLNIETKKLDDGTERMIILKADGTREEDNLGNPITFDSKIRQIAESYYDLQSSSSRSSGGDPNKKDPSKKDGGGGEKKWTGSIPKTLDELGATLADIRSKYPDLKERAEVIKEVNAAYSANQK